MTDPASAQGVRPPARYIGFISYSRVDVGPAKSLQAQLERFVIPSAMRRIRPGETYDRRPLRPVFRDEDELVPGADLPGRLRVALSESGFLIVICSPAGARSQWVEKEIATFLEGAPETRILTVVVEGEPNAERRGISPERECLPPSLRGSTESLWIDWRGAERGKRLPFLRIAAALLGLRSLDELVRRDAARRRGQRAAIVAGGSAVLSVIAGLCIYQVWARLSSARAESRTLADLAAAAADAGDFDQAGRFAVASVRRAETSLLALETPEGEAEVIRSAIDFEECVFRGHTGPVLSAAWSGDGLRVVSASQDGTAREWDARKCVAIGTPMHHDRDVTSAVFSPDGAYILTASSDATARVWSAGSHRPVGRPIVHDYGVAKAIYSPDGKRILTISATNVRLSDAMSGALLFDLPPMDQVAAAEFSPDGRRIATGSWNQNAQLWDAESGKPIGSPMKHRGVVEFIAFSPDGARLATGSRDKTARIWDASGHALCQPFPHDARVATVRFSPDGKYVVTASGDGLARIWEVDSCSPRGTPLQHAGGVLDAHFSADGRTVLTASDDSTVRLWRSALRFPAASVFRHEGTVYTAAFSPDGQYALSASGDRTIRIRRIVEPAASVSFRPPGLITAAAFSAVFSTVDHHLLIWGTAGAWLWNIREAEPVRLVDSEVAHAAFSPDGRRAVTGSADGWTRIWEVANGAPVRAMGPASPVSAVALARDGRALSGDSHGSVQIWLPDGKPGVRAGDGDNILSVSFSPDETRFVTASGHAARIRNAQTGEPAGAPLRHAETVRYATFSPDGRTVLTVSDDKTARLWDAGTGNPIGKPMLHEDWVVHGAFSPDGRLIATASNDRTAQIWNVRTGDPIGARLRHREMINQAGVSVLEVVPARICLFCCIFPGFPLCRHRIRR